MTRKKKSLIDEFLALSDAEKDAQVAEFEQGVDRSRFKPLSAADKKRWARARRKLGRPTVGRGSKTVAVTIERGLLGDVDRYAKSHNLKRSEMIAQGLRLLMRAG